MEDRLFKEAEDANCAKDLVQVALEAGAFRGVRIGDIGMEVEETLLVAFRQRFRSGKLRVSVASVVCSAGQRMLQTAPCPLVEDFELEDDPGHDGEEAEQDAELLKIEFHGDEAFTASTSADPCAPGRRAKHFTCPVQDGERGPGQRYGKESEERDPDLVDVPDRPIHDAQRGRA